jgi:hypothetical protein
LLGDLGKYWNEGAGKYWSAGRKASTDEKFKWHLPQGASDVQSAPTIRFAKDAKSAGGNDCLEVRIKDESAPDSAVLGIDDCETKKKFICEVKNPHCHQISSLLSISIKYFSCIFFHYTNCHHRILIIKLQAPLANPVPFPQCPDKAKCIADVSIRKSYITLYY